MKSFLQMVMLILLVTVASAPAQAHCVVCAFHPSSGCFGCADGGGFYHACILGDPCSGYPGQYNACANFGNCLALSANDGETTITFDETLVADVGQHNPHAASVLIWVNEIGGLRHDELVLNQADTSTEDPGDTVQFKLTVRSTDGRPSVVEVVAVEAYRNAPAMGTLVLTVPAHTVASSTFVATGWMHL